MVFLIDDKVSRQNSYGWDKDKLARYNFLVIINNADSLQENFDEIFKSKDNVVLFHESFLNSTEYTKCQIVGRFKNELDNQKGNIYIAYFSGSKNSRWIDDEHLICMMSPDVLYCNLSVFLDHYSNHDINFRYLLFGDNFRLESLLRNKIDDVSRREWMKDRVPTTVKVFYAYTDSYKCDCPFENEDVFVKDNWDFFNDQDVSDQKLDALVKEWFSDTSYDAIFIPLCFGKTLSDFLGLRLAMHIRFTSTICQYKPILIYGEADLDFVSKNECFDILKSTGVSMIHCDIDSMKYALDNRKFVDENLFEHEIQNIYLRVPSNVGDNHSVSNIWAIYRWKEMFNWVNGEPDIINSEFNTNLYFKYLVSRYGKHDRIKKNKHPLGIAGIKDKSIVYIDDEYDKGWLNILEKIFSYNKARLIPYTDFNKSYSRDELSCNLKDFIDENDADCYLVDLRLHDEDFKKDTDLLGHQISQYIKSKNKGNQIVVFTASNKIWNFRKEKFAPDNAPDKAFTPVGYVLKESPNQNYSKNASLSLIVNFMQKVQEACNHSYLRRLYTTQNELESITNEVTELKSSFIDMLSIDDENESVLKSCSLSLIVFLESYIKSNKLSILSSDNDTKVQLWKEDYLVQDLSNHLFVKRDSFGSHKGIIDFVYSEEDVSTPSLYQVALKSDAVEVIASLKCYYKLCDDAVRQYIKLKLYRNTCIAHDGDIDDNMKSKYDLKISVDKLLHFYYDVIVPVVKHRES